MILRHLIPLFGVLLYGHVTLAYFSHQHGGSSKEYTNVREKRDLVDLINVTNDTLAESSSVQFVQETPAEAEASKKQDVVTTKLVNNDHYLDTDDEKFDNEDGDDSENGAENITEFSNENSNDNQTPLVEKPVVIKVEKKPQAKEVKTKQKKPAPKKTENAKKKQFATEDFHADTMQRTPLVNTASPLSYHQIQEGPSIGPHVIDYQDEGVHVDNMEPLNGNLGHVNGNLGPINGNMGPSNSGLMNSNSGIMKGNFGINSISGLTSGSNDVVTTEVQPIPIEATHQDIHREDCRPPVCISHIEEPVIIHHAEPPPPCPPQQIMIPVPIVAPMPLPPPPPPPPPCTVHIPVVIHLKGKLAIKMKHCDNCDFSKNIESIGPLKIAPIHGLKSALGDLDSIGIKRSKMEYSANTFPLSLTEAFLKSDEITYASLEGDENEVRGTKKDITNSNEFQKRIVIQKTVVLSPMLLPNNAFKRGVVISLPKGKALLKCIVANNESAKINDSTTVATVSQLPTNNLTTEIQAQTPLELPPAVRFRAPTAQTPSAIESSPLSSSWLTPPAGSDVVQLTASAFPEQRFEAGMSSESERIDKLRDGFMKILDKDMMISLYKMAVRDILNELHAQKTQQKKNVLLRNKISGLENERLRLEREYPGIVNSLIKFSNEDMRLFPRSLKITENIKKMNNLKKPVHNKSVSKKISKRSVSNEITFKTDSNNKVLKLQPQKLEFSNETRRVQLVDTERHLKKKVAERENNNTVLKMKGKYGKKAVNNAFSFYGDLDPTKLIDESIGSPICVDASCEKHKQFLKHAGQYFESLDSLALEPYKRFMYVKNPSANENRPPKVYRLPYGETINVEGIKRRSNTISGSTQKRQSILDSHAAEPAEPPTTIVELFGKLPRVPLKITLNPKGPLAKLKKPIEIDLRPPGKGEPASKLIATANDPRVAVHIANKIFKEEPLDPKQEEKLQSVYADIKKRSTLTHKNTRKHSHRRSHKDLHRHVHKSKQIPGSRRSYHDQPVRRHVYLTPNSVQTNKGNSRMKIIVSLPKEITRLVSQHLPTTHHAQGKAYPNLGLMGKQTMVAQQNPYLFSRYKTKAALKAQSQDLEKQVDFTNAMLQAVQDADTQQSNPEVANRNEQLQVMENTKLLAKQHAKMKAIKNADLANMIAKQRKATDLHQEESPVTLESIEAKHLEETKTKEKQNLDKVAQYEKTLKMLQDETQTALEKFKQLNTKKDPYADIAKKRHSTTKEDKPKGDPYADVGASIGAMTKKSFLSRNISNEEAELTKKYQEVQNDPYATLGSTISPIEKRSKVHKHKLTHSHKSKLNKAVAKDQVPSGVGAISFVRHTPKTQLREADATARILQTSSLMQSSAVPAPQPAIASPIQLATTELVQHPAGTQDINNATMTNMEATVLSAFPHFKEALAKINPSTKRKLFLMEPFKFLSHLEAKENKTVEPVADPYADLGSSSSTTGSKRSKQHHPNRLHHHVKRDEEYDPYADLGTSIGLSQNESRMKKVENNTDDSKSEKQKPEPEKASATDTENNKSEEDKSKPVQTNTQKVSVSQIKNKLEEENKDVGTDVTIKKFDKNSALPEVRSNEMDQHSRYVNIAALHDKVSETFDPYADLGASSYESQLPSKASDKSNLNSPDKNDKNDTTAVPAKDNPSDSIPDKMTEKISEKLSDKSTETISEKQSEKQSEKLSDKTSDRIQEKMSERLPDKTTERLPDKTTEKLSEKTSDRISDKQSERLYERPPGESVKAVEKYPMDPNPRPEREGRLKQLSSTETLNAARILNKKPSIAEKLVEKLVLPIKGVLSANLQPKLRNSLSAKLRLSEASSESDYEKSGAETSSEKEKDVSAEKDLATIERLEKDIAAEKVKAEAEQVSDKTALQKNVGKEIQGPYTELGGTTTKKKSAETSPDKQLTKPSMMHRNSFASRVRNSTLAEKSEILKGHPISHYMKAMGVKKSTQTKLLNLLLEQARAQLKISSSKKLLSNAASNERDTDRSLGATDKKHTQVTNCMQSTPEEAMRYMKKTAEERVNKLTRNKSPYVTLGTTLKKKDVLPPCNIPFIKESESLPQESKLTDQNIEEVDALTNKMVFKNTTSSDSTPSEQTKQLVNSEQETIQLSIASDKNETSESVKIKEDESSDKTDKTKTDQDNSKIINDPYAELGSAVDKKKFIKDNKSVDTFDHVKGSLKSLINLSSTNTTNSAISSDRAGSQKKAAKSTESITNVEIRDPYTELGGVMP